MLCLELIGKKQGYRLLVSLSVLLKYLFYTSVKVLGKR
jgi:hypothetical protein